MFGLLKKLIKNLKKKREFRRKVENMKRNISVMRKVSIFFAVLMIVGLILPVGVKAEREYYIDSNLFSDGLAPVELGNKWGYINRKGKLIIPFEYDSVEDFRKGVAVVTKADKKGLIDKKGKIIVEFGIYDSFEIMDSGFISVSKYIRDKKTNEYLDTKTGIINKNGKIVVPLKYFAIGDCGESLFLASKQSVIGGKYFFGYGFVDIKGREVIPFIFHGFPGQQDVLTIFTKFERGRILLNKDGKNVVINKKGKILYSYKEIWSYSPNVKYAIASDVDHYTAIQKKKFFIIDNNGKKVTKAKYDFFGYDFVGYGTILTNYGYVGFRDGKKWKILDIERNKVLPIVSDSMPSISKKQFTIEKNNKIVIVDRSGKEIRKK